MHRATDRWQEKEVWSAGGCAVAKTDDAKIECWFGWGTLIAIAVLLATGAAMASHYHRWGDSTLHVKLALVALVAALVVWHMRRPAQHVLEGAIFLVSLAIVWLGLVLAHG